MATTGKKARKKPSEVQWCNDKDCSECSSVQCAKCSVVISDQLPCHDGFNGAHRRRRCGLKLSLPQSPHSGDVPYNHSFSFIFTHCPLPPLLSSSPLPLCFCQWCVVVQGRKGPEPRAPRQKPRRTRGTEGPKARGLDDKPFLAHTALPFPQSVCLSARLSASPCVTHPNRWLDTCQHFKLLLLVGDRRFCARPPHHRMALVRLSVCVCLSA